jgi:hypothetical protein
MNINKPKVLSQVLRVMLDKPLHNPLPMSSQEQEQRTLRNIQATRQARKANQPTVMLEGPTGEPLLVKTSALPPL